MRKKHHGPPRGYRVTITNGEKFYTLDSPAARVRRCQRRVMGWAKAIPQDARRIRRAGKTIPIGPRLVMLTLTYRDADAWKPNDIRNFMLGLRKELGEALLGYSWVLEMQKRGAPHYHVLVYVKRGTDVPKPDAGLWQHGWSKRETARTVFYICKYTGKAYQKNNLPPGARMFAVWIKPGALEALRLLPFRLTAVAKWLRPYIEQAAELVGAEITWGRMPGGGWIIRQTGECLFSAWRIVSVDPLDG